MYGLLENYPLTHRFSRLSSNSVTRIVHEQDHTVNSKLDEPFLCPVTQFQSERFDLLPEFTFIFEVVDVFLIKHVSDPVRESAVVELVHSLFPPGIISLTFFGPR